MTWNVAHILAATKNSAQIKNVTHVKDFCIHTNDLKKHDAFIALPPWPNNHGGAYIPIAEKKGAVIIYDKTTPLEPSSSAPSIQVPCVKTLLKQLSHYKSQNFTNKRIILTGSHGKTTTKEILRQLIPHTFATPKNFNTDISLYLTNINAPLDAPLCVFETGISKLHEMDNSIQCFPAQSFDAAIITNIAPVHIEFLKSLTNIIEQKTKIFSLLKHTGFAIFEGDQPYTPELAKKAQSFANAYFGKNNTCALQIHHTRLHAHHHQFSLTYAGETGTYTTPLLGDHMIRNIACAVLALLKIGLYTPSSLHNIGPAISRLQPYTGRGALVPFSHGTIHDYSYAAGSLLSVRENFTTFCHIPAKTHVAVVGDMAEQGEDRVQKVHEEFAHIIQHSRCNRIYLLGPVMQSLMPQSHRIKHLSTYKHITQDIQQYATDDTRVFVQGSRSFALEKFVSHLSLSAPI